MNWIFIIGAVLISTAYAEIKDDSASSALNKFALKFLAETSSKIPEDMNLAISPYTIWTAMSIVSEGARGNTAKELEDTLYIPSNGTDREQFRKLQQRIIQNIAQKYEGVTLDVLNAMFTRIEAILNQDYVRLVQDVYNTQVQPLDFKNATGAAKYINRVISDATRGRIPEIVNADTVNDAYMFITSALFFKGLWDKKFDKELTKPETFYNEHRKPIGTVPMMRTTGAFPFGKILNGKATAVELPYLGVKMSMVAILPTEGIPLSSVLSALSETSISRLVDDLNKTRDFLQAIDVIVEMPKFKISSSLNLNVVLHAMGIRDIFNWEYSDLTGISPAKLFVSRVLHKAEIEVDEQGTTGSAATVVPITDRISDVEYFTANKPFVFVVYDKKNKLITFTGKFSGSTK